jgi:hypothetical protein
MQTASSLSGAQRLGAPARSAAFWKSLDLEWKFPIGRGNRVPTVATRIEFPKAALRAHSKSIARH